MSKYSTDKLIDELETIVTEANASEQFKYSKLNRRIIDAIIARLRAADIMEEEKDKNTHELYKSHLLCRLEKADKLCEAAKFVTGRGNFYLDKLRKAIADYEGGK